MTKVVSKVVKSRTKKTDPVVEPVAPPPEPPQYTGPVVIIFETVQQWLYTRELLTVQPHTLNGSQILIHAHAIECLNQAIPHDNYNNTILNRYLSEQEEKARIARQEVLREQQQREYDANKDPKATPKVANTPATFRKEQSERK